MIEKLMNSPALQEAPANDMHDDEISKACFREMLEAVQAGDMEEAKLRMAGWLMCR